MHQRFAATVGPSALAGFAIAFAASAQVQIISLGALPGQNSSQATAMSADGLVVVGNTNGASSGGPAFRWTNEAGIETLSSTVQLNVRATNSSGVRAIATIFGGPAIWNTRVFDLNELSFTIDGFYGLALNSSGTIAAGNAWPGNRPARWTSSGGVVEILPINAVFGGPSDATDISGSGSTIVGSTQIDGRARAYLWTAGGGATLLDTRTESDSDSNARAISSDGAVIVGDYRIDSTIPFRAFRYTFVDGFVTLDPPSELYGESSAYCVNSDGSVIAGYVRAWPFGGPFRAMYWTESLGMVDLNEYLPLVGVDLTGWDLRWVTDISSDGSAVTGVGILNGASRAFLITGLPGTPLPCPGDTNGDNVVNFTDLNAVLADFGMSGTGLPGDVNGDEIVNFRDLNEVLAAFGTTCD